MKYLIIGLAFIFLFKSANVEANYGQYGLYQGAPPAATIIIDKTIRLPTTTKGGVATYVDNLTPADIRFRPGEAVYFRLKVKNTSSVALANITVNDIVPLYLQPQEGPGTYNEKTRTISYTIPSLAPNEEQISELKMTIAPQNELPADKGLFCLVNKAVAAAPQAGDEDTAQICIEKQVEAAPQIPTTGPEYGVALLAGQTILLTTGVLLSFVKKNSV